MTILDLKQKQDTGPVRSGKMKLIIENWRKHLLSEDIKTQLEHELIVYLESEDLNEGIMDRLLPYVLAGGAALGGLSGKAEAKPISPKQATGQLVKMLNKEVGKRKNRFGLPLKFNDFDPSVEKVGRSISRLTKALPPEKDEKEIINIVAKGILIGVDQKIDTSDMLDSAVRSLDLATKKALKKKKSKPKRQFINIRSTNPIQIALNSLNGITVDLIQKKNFDKSFDQFAKDLKAAKESGALPEGDFRKIVKILKGADKVVSKLQKVNDILKKNMD